MKPHDGNFLNRLRSVFLPPLAAILVLAGCDSGLDYHSVSSDSSFSRKTTQPEQTDVDRAQHLIDGNGVPFLEITGVGKTRHPAWIALYALAYAGKEVYDPKLSGLTDEQKFSSTISWLEKNLTRNRSGLWVWPYRFNSTYNDISIKAPWASAFAQATGIQAFLAAHEKTGNPKYLELARKAAQALFTPIKAGGFLFESNGDIWFEEIPTPANNPSHILNGHMRVLLALSDLSKATNDGNIAEWLKRGTDTLYRWLPKFDSGYWLRYDLNPRKKELLFRFANPYGYRHHELAISKITLRDPVSNAEVALNVGVNGDSEGGARIAGTHWGQIEQLAGRSARRLVPAALDDKPDEMRAPHTYFYLELPDEWRNNLRNEWYELAVEYYDDAAANISIQQRSISPGTTFRDMRDGDLHLTGAGHWRKWIVPVRPSDLGYWVGKSYAEKHNLYIGQIAKWDGRFKAWSTVAEGYLSMNQQPYLTDGEVFPSSITLPKQTPMLPIYSLDEKGVIVQHAADDSTRWTPEGNYDPSGGRGHPVYSPYVVAEQLRLGPSVPGAAYSTIDRSEIRREPALDWILNGSHSRSINGAKLYLYPFDNAYNDIFTKAGWPSAFGQAYIIKSLVFAYNNITPETPVLNALRSATNGFMVSVENGGITAEDRKRLPWYEEVPNATHVLNAHLVSLPELAEAARILSDASLQSLVGRGISALKDKLHLFDTGYWLRYDQNPKKELLLQLDWIEGDSSPLIDEVLLQNPQTGHYVRLNVGNTGDADGNIRLSGSEWQTEQIVDGKTVRPFGNGYVARSNTVPGGARHNVFFVLRLPDQAFSDVFDVPPHRLIVRYKDTGIGTFGLRIQSISEGNQLTFVPLRGGIWTLVGDQQWKEVIFTIRPQDMGWYKGPVYQQYEVEQLQRLATPVNDWFFEQYADRHREFLEMQRKGVAAIEDEDASSKALPLAMTVLNASETYPGYGYQNSLDGDPNDDYTAGVENDPGYVVLKLDRAAILKDVRLQWESENNRPGRVVVSTTGPNHSAERVIADVGISAGISASIPIEMKTPADTIRIDFYDFLGQPRILLRSISITESKPAFDETGTTQFNRKTAPFMSADDPDNPLNIFRIPISSSVVRISDKLAVGAVSDHEKVVRFMRYIGQFRVGVAADASPETAINEQLGACGTFTNTLLALSAAQGLKGRVVSMLNYPVNDGHALAEIFADGQWRLYDPTYGTYYLDNEKPHAGALSFLAVMHAFTAGTPEIKREVLTGRPGVDDFTGREIFLNANPAGVIGPDHPMAFPLSLHATEFPALDEKEFGPKFQGASFIGAASTNQNHIWTVSGLTPGAEYIFSLQPKRIGGDIKNGDDRKFVVTASIVGAKMESNFRHIFDFSSDSVKPWELSFKADNPEVRILLNHPYDGPDLRYMMMKSYSVKHIDRNEK